MDVLLTVAGPDAPGTGAHDGPRDRRELRGGSRVDISVRSLAELRARVDGLARHCQDPARPLPLGAEVEEAVRLLYAETCYETPQYAAVRRDLEALREPLRAALVRALLRRAASRYEDLLGFVETGDAESAAMLSAEAVLRAVHTFLVSCGDLYLEEKWVWQKLARARPSGLPAARLRSLYFADARDGAVVARRTAAAREVFSVVLRNEHDRRPGRWPAPETSAGDPAGRPPNPWNDPLLDVLITDGNADDSSDSAPQLAPAEPSRRARPVRTGSGRNSDA